MFERFTDRARRVIVVAQEDARRRGYDHIGTEHVLLALLDDRNGIAARALVLLGSPLDELRRELDELVAMGGASPASQIPFTPRAKKVLELALREALQLGHNHIGTEHILLGLIREGEGRAAQLLHRRGVELGPARRQVDLLLSGFRGDEPEQRSTATHRAATVLRGWPEVPLWRALLEAGEEMRATTLEALIALWDGDERGLEERLGRLAQLAALAGDGAQLERLRHLVEIDDAQEGVVRLRSRPDPPDPPAEGRS